MIENYRSGLLWRLMRQCPYLATGLRRADSQEAGWSVTIPPTTKSSRRRRPYKFHQSKKRHRTTMTLSSRLAPPQRDELHGDTLRFLAVELVQKPKSVLSHSLHVMTWSSIVATPVGNAAVPSRRGCWTGPPSNSSKARTWQISPNGYRNGATGVGRLRQPSTSRFRPPFLVPRCTNASAHAATLTSLTRCCPPCFTNLATTRKRRPPQKESPYDRPSRSDALVLFGVTGDLAHKMIFPALYALTKRAP